MTDRLLTSDKCFACEGDPKPGNDPCVICGRETIPPIAIPEDEIEDNGELSSDHYDAMMEAYSD